MVLPLGVGGDPTSSERSKLHNDTAEILVVTGSPHRRVKRRIDCGEDLLDTSTVQVSEQSIDGGRVASEITDSDHPSNPSLQRSVNLQGLESAVNSINEGECLENGGSSTHAANPEVDSSNHTSYEEVYGFRPRNESDYIYWMSLVKRHEKLKARMAETKTCRSFECPLMTISHLVTCFSIEDLSRNAQFGWKVERLTNEMIRSRFDGLIRKEEAGISEHAISRRLKTRVYAPSANGLLSKGSTGSTDKQENCCICAEKYQKDDSIADLYYCEHHFHADCIKKWLLQKNTCPMCRSLAIIPRTLPDWNGDLRLHRAFFKRL